MSQPDPQPTTTPGAPPSILGAADAAPRLDAPATAPASGSGGSDGQRVARASRWVSIITLLSRVAGLARDKCLAMLFVGNAIWILDAFLFAFTIPNLFRRLFGEGALTAAFVPRFVQEHESEGVAAAAGFASKVLTLLVIVTGLIAGGGMLLCLGATRWVEPDQGWALTLRLLIIMLPFLMLICVSALLGGMLQAVHRFLLPAAMSILLNLAFLGAFALVLARHWRATPFGWRQSLDETLLNLDGSALLQAAYWLAFATLLAGAVQWVVQWPALAARGIHLLPSLALRDARVGAVAKALGPTALGLGVVQLNVLVDSLIAYSLSTMQVAGPLGEPITPLAGATSFLYFGNRLMQLPLGVFAIAIATTAFPFLARSAARKDLTTFFHTLQGNMRFMLFVMLPAGFGLAAMAMPILRMIYQEPDLAFGEAALYRSSRVLVLYALGLPCFGLLQLLTRAFYALGDYTRPVRIALAMVAVNLSLNLLLIHAPDLYLHWSRGSVEGLRALPALGQGWLGGGGPNLGIGESGLALATTITAMIQVALLWGALKRSYREALGERLWDDLGGQLLGRALLILAVSAGLALFAYWTTNSIPWGPELIYRVERAGVPILATAGLYVILCMILPIPEWYEFVRKLPPETEDGEAEDDAPPAGSDSA